MVTVLIPFYNRKNFVRDAVESVIQQTYKGWRILLIDDGSTDNGVETIKDYLSNKKVRVIHNKHNIGKVASLNKALQYVETPFICELDSDDILFPNTLETLVNLAKDYSEEYAVFSGNMVSTRINRNTKKVINCFIVKGKQHNDKYDFLLTNKVVWPRFYRTKALLSIGGWPDDDPYGGRHGIDDLRVLLRLIEKYKFKYIDKELITIRLHGDNISDDRKVIAEVKEWAVRDALKRWGDHYTPVFQDIEGGWRRVTKLIPKAKDE